MNLTQIYFNPKLILISNFRLLKRLINIFKLKFIKHRFNHRFNFHTINQIKSYHTTNYNQSLNPKKEIYSLIKTINKTLIMIINMIQINKNTFK